MPHPLPGINPPVIPPSIVEALISKRELQKFEKTQNKHKK